MIGALAILSLRREERTFVERWSVQILDESLRPAAGIRVSESGNDYNVDWHDSGDRYTDSVGRVTFPRRWLKATRLYWALASVLTRLNYGAHASSGTSRDSVCD